MTALSWEALTAVAVAYLLLLFLVAYAAERGWIPARLSRHPLVYALALGAYATSWSYFGTVGYAQREGFRYLALYLGATLSCALVPVLWRPVLRLTRELQLTSLADLFAYRFPGQLTGTLVTLFLVAGSLPYMALQIRALSDSAGALSPAAHGSAVSLVVCAALVLFSILFGARHVTPGERHEGLILAIAFESVIKVVALACVALFAVHAVLGGATGLGGWLSAHPEATARLVEPARNADWTSFLLLSFAAAFLLPRQYHLAFTESPEKDALGTAAWAFPLLMLAMTVAIPPIVWAGSMIAPGGPADLYALSVPTMLGSRALAVFAFLGGVSASSAMVIVTALALAPMGLTHLVLPLGFASAKRDLYRRLLWARRALIGVVIAAGYGFSLALDPHVVGLVDLGLVAFVGVAQFLPGLLGLLFWPRATRQGFLAGLAAGIAIWALTLLLPLFSHTAISAPTGGLAALLGFPSAEPWGFVVFSSLTLNALLFAGVSLFTRQTREEEVAARTCARRIPVGSGGVVAAASPAAFSEQLAPYLGEEAAQAEVHRALQSLGMDEAERRPMELLRLRDAILRNLSGLLGPVLAGMVVQEGLRLEPGARTVLADQLRLLEQRLVAAAAADSTLQELEEVRRYLRRILEELPLGVCALGPDEDVVIWNNALEEIAHVPGFRVEGLRVRELPEPWPGVLGPLARGDGAVPAEVRAAIGGVPRVLGLHRTALGGRGGAVLLVEDLTDQKAVEQRLAHQDRLASLGRVAAGVAHEIGNPLTGIASVAQNLKHEADPQEVPERMDLILQQVRRIESIVRALVSFSHAGTAGSSGTSVRVPARKLADEAIALSRLGRKRSAPRCENLCPPEIELQGDPQKLEQVLVNLLTNAFDATPADRKVEVRAERAGRDVKLTVTDEGSGIPPELHARIFEPFFTTKPPGQGTGLGLALVSGIVRDHGGTVSLDSQPGRGTTITLMLPGAAEAGEEKGAA